VAADSARLIASIGLAQATGDRHAILVGQSTCRLYELYDLHHTSHGWAAGSGATWDLRSNHLRPAGWTSADAAGLPIFPGLARWGEVSRGVIDHALRFTAPQTRRAYVYPARHYASSSNDPSLPPMGLRVRLKASVDIASFPRQARIVLRALQRYGMILTDNGSPWYVSGAPKPPLVERRPPHARPPHGRRLRGRRHVIPAGTREVASCPTHGRCERG
jgi:hypothetical protein